MAVTKIDGARQFKATNDVSLLDPNDGTTKHKLTNVGYPSGTSDAATKGFVIDSLYTLGVKGTCRAATLTHISSTYGNGSSGVGATLSGTGALSSQDGISLSLNDRLLVKDQTNAFENGIYFLSATSPFTLTRSLDADTAMTEVFAGIFTFIDEGTSQADTGWALISDNPITMGTSDLNWEQFSGPGSSLDSSNFVVRETPTGTINGTNLDFTLAYTPITSKESVYLNGLLQDSGSGNDYTMSSNIIHFLSAPVGADKIRASYIK